MNLNDNFVVSKYITVLNPTQQRFDLEISSLEF